MSPAGAKRVRAAVPAVILLATALTTGGAESAVVVESVEAANGAARAGLRPGDLLLGWERLAVEPAHPHSARGSLGSPFDLRTLEVQQAPLGPVRISLRRAGQALVVEMGAEQWRVSSRPALANGDRASYEVGATLLEVDSKRAFEVWGGLAGELAAEASKIDAAWLYRMIAEALSTGGSREEARKFFAEAVRQTQAAGHAEAGAQVLRSRASILEKDNDLEGAAAVHREALALRRGIARPRGVSRLGVAETLSDLGTLSWQLGDLDTSFELLVEARRIRQEEAPGSLAVAAAFQMLAIPTAMRGDYAAGARDLVRSYEILQSIAPQSHEMVNTSNALGILETRRGRLEAAEGHYQRALGIVERLEPGGRMEARLLANLTDLSLNLWDLSAAEGYVLRSREILERLAPRSPTMAVALANLSVVRSRRGDLEVSLDLRRKSTEIWEEVASEHFFLPMAYASTCTIAVELGRTDEAEEAYRRAMTKIGSEPQQGIHVAIAKQLLGACRARLGDYETAERLYLEVLERVQEMVPGSLHEAQALNNLGELHSATGRLEDAREGFERSLEISERLSPGGKEIVVSLHGLADLDRREDDSVAALGHLKEAVGALEEQSRHAGGDYEAWAKFQERNSTLYRDYVRLLIETGRLREAFHTLERSRARAFLDLLAARRLSLPRRLRPELESAYAEAIEVYDRVLSELAALDSRSQNERFEEIRQRLAAARRRRDEVRAQVWAADPRLAEIEHPEPLDVESAAAVLGPGTLLLAFFVDQDASYLFAVGPEPGEFAVHRIDRGKLELAEDVTRFRSLVGKVGSLDAVKLLAGNLSLHLLQPAADAISRSSRILVAPDGPLHSLPFAALGDPTRPGSFLIEVAPLTVVASATVYSQLVRRRTQRPPQSLVAFGDPAYPAADNPLPAGDLVLRTALGQGLELTPLPASRQEVETIAAFFPESSEVYLGQEATEERAKSVGETTSILHFALHASIDRRFPLDSALVLTIPDRPVEGGDNGFLQAWEIFEQMRLGADLVTLSACETARGVELAGEGLVGLVRAFQFAGARSVLASLWAVGDAGTAELMKRFYGYLSAGAATDEALRKAQLDLLLARETPDRFLQPFFWAAFQLMGDWR